ncbi:MAG: autotransporter-associated beta strand repeat-containing protein [Opitutaceae bacterium]|jgi:autotransporter-associated beta strand protein|nr:autotransporter-associated beta strand repeat-containing protein [Opitutaceae bacterium]
MNYPRLIRSLGLLASLCSAPVFAQDTTVWTGAGTNAFWNNSSNWSNLATSVTKAAIFDETSTVNLAGLALNGGITTQGITVGSPGIDLNLAMAAHVLTVGSGGITLNGTRNLTLTRGSTGQAAFVAISGSQTWSVAAGRTLTLTTNGEYDIINNGAVVTLTGGGAVTVNSINFDIGQTNSNTVNVDGVTLTSSTGIRLGQSNAGVHGVGTMNVNSGTVIANTLFQLGSAAGASGHLTVQGGAVLRTPLLRSVAGAAASSVTFDGATFVRLVPIDTTLVNIIDLNGGNFTTSLGDGGLTIDTNGQDVGLKAPLGNKSGEVGVLTKTGAGALTISSVNTFTGLTTVSAGKLVLDATGTLASTAYRVESGATLEVAAKSSYSLAGVNLTLGAGTGANALFNAGTAELALGGNLTIALSATTPDASYNLIDLGSQTGDFASVAITGSRAGTLTRSSADTWTGTFGGYDWTFRETTGVLSVVPEGTVQNNYSSWATENGLTGPSAAETADPDGDGATNLTEYALGTEPADATSRPAANALSGSVVTYAKGAEAILNGDVSWVIETTANLATGPWTARVTHAAGNTAPTISYDLATGGLQQNFARLRVTRTP